MEEKINLKYVDVSGIENYGDSAEYTDKEYTIEDCVLVRTTDIFPSNQVIQTPLNAKACSKGESFYIGDIIHKKLKQKYPKYSIDESECEKFNEELNKYYVCYQSHRSTIHFCINGLVGSHAYGNFENRSFIIIDPLKYHLDNSLKGLRVEDTYFNDDMRLSNECVILIKEEVFKSISNNAQYLNELKNFKVYVFKGDEQIALKEVLKDLGYDSFMVNSHGYSNGLDQSLAAGKMYNYINKFALQNNIGSDRHYYSKIKEEDDNKLFEHTKEVDKKHILYLLDNLNIPTELRENIKQVLEEVNNMNYIKFILEPMLEKIIDLIGIDTIKKLTEEFNKNFINNLNLSKTRVIK